MDPSLQAQFEQARQTGFDEGFAEGARAAEAALRETERRAIDAIEQAAGEATSRIRDAVEQAAPELLALALDIARRIVADLPADADRGLAHRIDAALSEIDDEQLVLRVHPADAATVAGLVAQVSNLALEPDDSLERGDALIGGRWARADLTLTTAWQVVQAELVR